MDKPLQRFSFEDMQKELRKAEREKRAADFTYKLMPEFSFSDKQINVGLNFQGSTIQGAIYVDKCVFEKQINLENVLVYTTLYISNSEFKEDFVAKKIRIREVANLVASKFYKNVIFDEASVKGFLGLNKAVIEEDLSIKNVSIIDINTKTGTITGDLFLKEAHIKGSVFLEELIVEGLVSLENSFIEGDLSFKDSRVKENVLLSGTIVEGDVITEELKSKNLIAHMA
jgi:cytoskeletal protein CcmA (bactofilin family)